MAVGCYGGEAHGVLREPALYVFARRCASFCRARCAKRGEAEPRQAFAARSAAARYGSRKNIEIVRRGGGEGGRARHFSMLNAPLPALADIRVARVQLL